MSSFWILSLLLSVTLVTASWKDSYNTIDGSQEVILVVETHSVDLSELDPELTEDDLSALPLCSHLNSSLVGTTPCRDRPNFFTSLDYDASSDTFHVITGRGPVVDCYSFPALQTENNTVGNPDTEGVYVPGYTPVLASFQIDGESLSNYQYTQLTGTSGPLTGLAKSSRENEMYGPECTNLPATDYPLSFDPSGISPTSLRRISVDGEIFYLAVEDFGPSILVLNSTGEVIRAYVPANSPAAVINHGLYPVTANLPSILLQAQVSRSFSALSYDESSHSAYVFLEAPLGVDQASTFVRVLQLNATNLWDIQYTGMYGFLLDSAQQYIAEGGSTSQLPLISVVAADLFSDKSFLIVERQLVSHSTSTFTLLDLSNATNLKGAWDKDLQLEQISANNNALLLDNEALNDQFRTSFASLHPPVYLGYTQKLFDSQQVRQWGGYSLDGEDVSSIRVISDSVVAVGVDNNWGYTQTADAYGKLFFVRLGVPSTSALVNSAPVTGPAGNALILSDSSSMEAASQKKQWATSVQTSAYEWDSLHSTFTIELWFNWRGGSQVSAFQPLISRALNSSFESAHFILGVDTSSTGSLASGSLRGIVGCTNAVGFDISAGTAISTDVWHHVAFVVSSSSKSAQLYLDGALTGSGSWSVDCSSSSIPTVNSDNVNIGSFDTLGINGVVDELRFWSAARTAQQIQNWSHSSLSGSEQGLVAYFQFNDVPSTQKSEFDNQYFGSTGSASGLRGLIQPMPSDKTRFTPSGATLINSVTVLAIEADISAPYQNTITLLATDVEQDPITYSIVELSPELAGLLNSDNDDSIIIAQPNGSLNLTTLPVVLASNKVTIFVTCNNSLCSNLPSDDKLWFRYSASSQGGVSSDIVYLQVEMCTNLDACGVCNGDNGQCQCACYHGFSAEFMDYTLFSFLLNENIAKINHLLEILTPLIGTNGTLQTRWKPGQQYTDYTPFLEAQKAFTTGCLDTYCDTFNPFESEFYQNLAEFGDAPTDYNTCSCDQSPPDTEALPPVYSL